MIAFPRAEALRDGSNHAAKVQTVMTAKALEDSPELAEVVAHQILEKEAA